MRLSMASLQLKRARVRFSAAERRTADLLGLDPVVADLLSEPLRELTFRLAVRLDHGGGRHLDLLLRNIGTMEA